MGEALVLVRVAIAWRDISSSSRSTFAILSVRVWSPLHRKVRHQTDETTPSPSLFTLHSKLGLDASAIEVEVCAAYSVAFEACQTALSSARWVDDYILGLVECCNDMFTKDDGVEVLVREAEPKKRLVVQRAEKHQVKFRREVEERHRGYLDADAGWICFRQSTDRI